ncbi:VanZ family protein [Streptomyces sp. TP-A0874]|uniref:VanZ family protein n=1 Tax=Streptomyces sp. TP-A0874 TaxID=549819 RepID=UPI000852F613|nr:VanZ family protein [Streptomyces sp. TP-A0874]
MQRHGSGDSATFHFRAAGSVFLLAHLLFVGWLTLRPLSVPWVTATNLRPLATIQAELELGPWTALRHLGGDLLLLAPLGVLLPMAAGRLLNRGPALFLRTVLLGALVSLGTAVLHVNVAGRTFDVDSLLLNTAGVALAHLLLIPPARAWFRARLRRSEQRGGARSREEPAGEATTLPSIGLAP